MKLHTPPENQGQIVEVSYGWSEGSLYKRVHDRSDRSTQWYRASDEEEVNAYEQSVSSTVQAVTTWTPCEEPEPPED